MSLETVLSDFLHLHCAGGKRLLLGLSGGPDSMALFQLLVRAKYPFEVAHVDHGWRRESSEEAAYLRALCQRAGVVFHCKRLLPPQDKKNLEERGREERHAFFKEIIERQGLEGVFLAHQADDQAETILKRIFEGSSLSKLKGLAPRVVIQGVTIYRPLLKVEKREIVEWLTRNQMTFFVDPTNSDPHFLRTRLRETLIPLLSDHFGKKIASSLCRIGESASELSAYLEEQILPFKEQIQRSQGAVSLNFERAPFQSPFLWKAVIRDLFDSERLALSSSVLSTILEHLQKGNGHKSLRVGRLEVCIHRKELTIHKDPSYDITEHKTLKTKNLSR